MRSRAPIHSVICAVLLACTIVGAQAVAEELIAEWNFDFIQNGRVPETVSGSTDRISGHFDIVEGVVGSAIKCDGFTTAVDRDGEDAPRLDGAFTIEAWVAPQAYPWNWCAIYNQEYHRQRGVFFGIDGEGRVGLHAAVARQWRECISDKKIPFMEWSHVVGTFDPNTGLRVFINGALSGKLNVVGDLLVDRDFDLQIARNHELTIPASLNRAGLVRVPASYSFDGIIDELRITEGARSPEKIAESYRKLNSTAKPQLTWRKLPHISTEQEEFGAFYTKLKYDADWDRLWRDDSFPDVVVTFPEERYSMVFWKGTNYNMNLVTENGKWMADQSAETFGRYGCMEHMSDKQNRYSHVRVLENSDARVIVHWRYALADILYQIANTDPVTNWGDWADEYYAIYPDGIAVRHYMVHGYEQEGYSITEPALLCSPGEVPEDNIELTAVTLANLKGETSHHSYETWPGGRGGSFKGAVEEACIAIVNVKSEFKPFYIFEPGSAMGPYGGGTREIDYRLSKFHWRNHWPVAQIPCDGRFTLANDRVTSSAIISAMPKSERGDGGIPFEGRFIMGISGRPAKELVPFARFWLSPPELDIQTEGYQSAGFYRDDRAYHISKESDNAEELIIRVDANAESPLVNPAFVIENWGNSVVKILVNGQEQTNPETCQYSIRRTLQSKDLIVWLEMNFDDEVIVSFVRS